MYRVCGDVTTTVPARRHAPCSQSMSGAQDPEPGVSTQQSQGPGWGSGTGSWGSQIQDSGTRLSTLDINSESLGPRTREDVPAVESGRCESSIRGSSRLNLYRGSIRLLGLTRFRTRDQAPRIQGPSQHLSKLRYSRIPAPSGKRHHQDPGSCLLIRHRSIPAIDDMLARPVL